MAIQPKDLNQSNRGYGYKEMQHQWQNAFLPMLQKVIDHYNNGGYDQVIREGIELFSSKVKSISDLPNMNEANLAALYYVGKAYSGLGQVDNAIACFHIVYSQNRFGKKMLQGFSDYVERAGVELQEIAENRGEDYVNNVQVESFLSNNAGKSGGCFIATAVYGSSFTPEVQVFYEFRDKALLTTQFGTILVRAYYVVSPPLAAVISKSDLLKGATRRLLLAPTLRLLNLFSISNSKGEK